MGRGQGSGRSNKGGGGGGEGKPASEVAKQAPPSKALLDERVELAMKLDRLLDPNARSTNNMYREMQTKKLLREFDEKHPEVKEHIKREWDGYPSYLLNP